MGIRDVSFYGWEFINKVGPNPSQGIVSASFERVVEHSGVLYALGWYHDGRGVSIGGSALGSFVQRSLDGESWETILFDITGSGARSIAFDSSGSIYLGTGYGVAKSHISSATDWNYVLTTNDSRGGPQGNGFIANAIQVINDQTVVVAMHVETGASGIGTTDTAGAIFTSSNRGESWELIETNKGTGASAGEGNGGFFDMARDPSGSLFVVGYTGSDNTHYSSYIKSSSDKGATWVEVFNSQSTNEGTSQLSSIVIDQKNNIKYVARQGDVVSPYDSQVGAILTASAQHPVGNTEWSGSNSPEGTSDGEEGIVSLGITDADLYKVTSLTSSISVRRTNEFEQLTTFVNVDSLPGRCEDIFITDSLDIYTCGRVNEKEAFVRKGRLQANSQSFGESTLAPSLNYVFSELSGVQDTRYRLANVSEFPHSNGLFQMKNIILGTVDSGKVGSTEDAILQVRYFGSKVSVLWPKQGEQNSLVKGFGDFSSGQRPGKLTTTFEPGDNVDVEDFDHLTLFCYLKKQISGTSDTIEIKIERRPLKSVGFVSEQAIEYSTDTETSATLTDIIYKKDIDYSDLSITEIGFPIDIPLTNTKEIRVQARHLNGQSEEENKNFIIWGRFIKSEEET